MYVCRDYSEVEEKRCIDELVRKGVRGEVIPECWFARKGLYTVVVKSILLNSASQIWITTSLLTSLKTLENIAMSLYFSFSLAEYEFKVACSAQCSIKYYNGECVLWHKVLLGIYPALRKEVERDF